MSNKSSLMKVVVPLVILLAGFALTVIIIKSRKPPAKEPAKVAGVLVNVISAKATDYTVYISGTGTVSPGKSVSFMPQVSGRIIWTSPSFAEGGFFAKGEPILRIDPTDYELAVDQAASKLAQAEVDLETARSKARIAREEWDLVSGGKGEPNPLVLYEPQLKSAEAALDSARASLMQAELNLERTEVLAPFACRISAKDAEQGQSVSTSTKLATIAGTEAAEVAVAMDYDSLKWFKSYRPDGAEATVSMSVGGAEHSWDGVVLRTGGHIDETSRTIDVYIGVKDPYNLKAAKQRPALPNGTFVRASINAGTIKNAIVLPREAVRDNSTLWIASEGDALSIRKVEIAFETRDEAVVTSGLSPGERVVITKISGAADGLKLRINSGG